MADNDCAQMTAFDGTDHYFMGIAYLTAKQSEDPKCKVGACVVDEKKEVVSVGYNKMPEGTSGFSWDRTRDVNDALLYVCHAELNAIVNKGTARMKGCTLYVTRLPCNECAKLVIQSGIRRVIYLSDRKASKKTYVASRSMLSEAGVSCKKLPKPEEIHLTFGDDLYHSDEE